MICRIVAGLLVCLLGCVSAAAQGCGPSNPNCVVPLRPSGDSTNAAASTKFVATAISPFTAFPSPTRAGDVIYWNGSSWVTLPGNNAGTNFLQENSSGSPSWGTPTPPTQAFVLLNTLTASSSATLSDTSSLTGSYSNYLITFQNLICSVATSTQLELQVHSGGNFQATTYGGGTARINGAGAGFTAASTFIQLSETNTNMSTSPGISGTLTISIPSQTASPKVWNGNLSDTATPGVSIVGAWWNGGNGAVDGFRVQFGTGNITSGVIEIYGMQ